mmetsp:Transcript_7472/g.12998  ORF Transcript_7472/g.12998 Transcript_7472/m.12998 type:complete len:240 (-) Transcript_7472:230-949(-)
MGSMGTRDPVADAQRQVAALNAKLGESKGMVKQWCEAKREQADKNAESALERLQHIAERVAVLRTEHAELESMGYTNAIKLDAERKKVADLHDALDELRAEESSVHEKMSAIEQSRIEKQSTVEKLLNTLQDENEKNEYQANLLTRGAKMFKRLGLEFERVGESRLRLSFTQIDPTNPGKLFFIVIYIDDNDFYHVEQVQPAIGNISDLLQAVNNDNNFALFVRRIRQRFKALCAPSCA